MLLDSTGETKYSDRDLGKIVGVAAKRKLL
jgi:hypothetical protein